VKSCTSRLASAATRSALRSEEIIVHIVDYKMKIYAKFKMHVTGSHHTRLHESHVHCIALLETCVEFMILCRLFFSVTVQVSYLVFCIFAVILL